MGPVRSIVIVGGGVAGWMSALALVRALAGGDHAVHLVEVPGEDRSLGSIGPALATPPLFDAFLAEQGFGEDDLLRACHGSFALGRAFSGWDAAEGAWFLPFGEVGAPMGPVAFHHLAARLRETGQPVRLADYSVAAVAAASGRFARPAADKRSVLSSYGYGLHLDAARFARVLAAAAKAAGVQTHPSAYRRAVLAQDGSIASVELDGGESLEGDLFIDCTGPAALLIRGALGTGFVDWSRWLPCDRVRSWSNQAAGTPLPFEHAGAHAAGWRRTVPLLGGQGEALFYSAAHLSDADADGLGHAAMPFVSGRAARAWHRNCIAIGASAELTEPLHGQNVLLVHRALRRLIALFPSGTGSAEAAEYNRLAAAEAESVRDLLILHYKANGRAGDAFWEDCRGMPVPDTLAHKIDLFASRGMVAMYDDELFDRADWITALDGMGIRPRRRDALADTIPEPALYQHFTRLREVILHGVQSLPSHGATLHQLGLMP